MNDSTLLSNSVSQASADILSEANSFIIKPVLCSSDNSVNALHEILDRIEKGECSFDIVIQSSQVLKSFMLLCLINKKLVSHSFRIERCGKPYVIADSSLSVVQIRWNVLIGRL